MTTDSRLRITTWPADQVPEPLVERFPQACLHGDVLHLGTERQLVAVPDQVRLFELTDVDLDDREALVGLVRDLGSVAPYNLGSDLTNDGAAQVGRHAQQHGRLFDHAEHRTAGDLMTSANRPDGPYVHLDEIAYRLRLLRALTEHAVAHALGRPVHEVQWPRNGANRVRSEVGDWRHFASHMQAALRPFQVRVHVAIGDEDVTPTASPGLFSLAALQMVNDMMQHLDYHVCAADQCGRLFVRQRGRSVHYSRTKGSIYCSKSCMNAQTQREYRRRQRAARKAETP